MSKCLDVSLIIISDELKLSLIRDKKKKRNIHMFMIIILYSCS